MSTPTITVLLTHFVVVFGICLDMKQLAGDFFQVVTEPVYSVPIVKVVTVSPTQCNRLIVTTVVGRHRKSSGGEVLRC